MADAKSVLRSSQRMTVKALAGMLLVFYLVVIALIVTPILLIRLYLPGGEDIGFLVHHAIALIPQAVTDIYHSIRYAYLGLLLVPCLGLFTLYALLKRRGWAIWLHIISIGVWLCQTVVFFGGFIYSLFYVEHYIEQNFPRLASYLPESLLSAELWMIAIALILVALQTWFIVSLLKYKEI